MSNNKFSSFAGVGLNHWQLGLRNNPHDMYLVSVTDGALSWKRIDVNDEGIYTLPISAFLRVKYNNSLT